MTAKNQFATNFRLENSRTIDNNGQEREYCEVEVLDEGEQHHDVGLRKAEDNTKKNVPAKRRSSVRAFEVTLGVLYCLILVGITTHYVLVTLDKQQLQDKNNKLSSDYSQLQANVSSYDILNKNYSQLQAKLSDISISNSQLQEEMKQLKNKIKRNQCSEGWMRFGCSCYFKSTERKTWSDCRTECENKGADLVIINSEEEQKFIHENMRGDSWIGLRYVYEKSTWKWEWVDGSPLTERFWAAEELDPREWYYAACCDNNGKWTPSFYKSHEFKTWICEK